MTKTKTFLTSLAFVAVAGAIGCSSSASKAPDGAAGSGGIAGGAGGATAGAAGTTPGVGGGSAGATGGGGAGGAATGGAGGAATGGAGGAVTGGAGGAGTAGAGGATAECNTLLLSGPQISKVTHAGAAPTMTGGTIVLGNYLLTNMDKYNGTQGSNTKRETWVFTAGHFEVAGEDSGTPGIDRRSGSFSTAANVVTLTVTCPVVNAGVVMAQFTSVNGTISTLSQPQSSDQEIHTITKQ